ERSRLGGRGNGPDASRLGCLCDQRALATSLIGRRSPTRRIRDKNLEMTTGDAADADAAYVPKPGFGIPPPHIEAAFAASPPVVRQEVVWGTDLHLDASAHAGTIALADDLVMSARTVIRVGDRA